MGEEEGVRGGRVDDRRSREKEAFFREMRERV